MFTGTPIRWRHINVCALLVSSSVHGLMSGHYARDIPTIEAGVTVFRFFSVCKLASRGGGILSPLREVALASH